jgi:hypothetical protein
LNASAPSYWKSGKDAWMIWLVSELYPMVVICTSWVWDSFCIACQFWLPYHISKKLWTLAIRCSFSSSASICISTMVSVLILTNSGSAPVSISRLAWANCLTTTF